MNLAILTAALALAGGDAVPRTSSLPTLSGDYVEVRTCDVFTGPCFANAQMNLEGREAILVWSIRSGAWRGLALDGLKVAAVVRAENTLGDVHAFPSAGRAVIVVDAAATDRQRQALTDFAAFMAGDLVREVVDVKSAEIRASIGACSRSGCASVQAGDLVRIRTRCLGEKDHLCGNEETYYPPLTRVMRPMPAYTELASYEGDGLKLTFSATAQRSAFLGAFGL